ncbi:hypothetical protein [Streptomyces sp. NPDC058653]|uniref:hypothetical protein n=1 Tax=Streptomyces sp. NPDC058653 TaxID=3346576 RepID=UPI003654A8E2
MKTCHRFAAVRKEYERDISYLTAHSVRHKGRPSGKASAKNAIAAKQRMARALSRHLSRCPECG